MGTRASEEIKQNSKGNFHVFPPPTFSSGTLVNVPIIISYSSIKIRRKKVWNAPNFEGILGNNEKSRGICVISSSWSLYHFTSSHHTTLVGGVKERERTELPWLLYLFIIHGERNLFHLLCFVLFFVCSFHSIYF